MYPRHFLQSANPQASEKAQHHICTQQLWVCTCCAPYCQECRLPTASNREDALLQTEVAGQLSNQILTAASFPLLSLLSVKSVLAYSKLFFQTDSSLSQKPFANSLVTVKPVDGHVLL